MGSVNSLNREKGKKIIIVVVIADLILLAGGLAVFFLLFKGDNDSPEKLAQEVLEAAYNKDWKTIIDQTPDEALEMLLQVDEEYTANKDITTVRELRDWAAEHVKDVPDPMNGKAIEDYKVKEVKTMTPSEYIETYLGGMGTNAFYSFLKSGEEIAVAEITYTMVDGDKKEERRSDGIVEYKKNGKWYSLVGLQVLDEMLNME